MKFSNSGLKMLLIMSIQKHHCCNSVKSRKIHEELFELLLKLERDSLPRSGLGKAVAYTLNLWEGLSEFLNDPYIPMTNNMA